MAYKIQWDNGHASGVLAGKFTSRKAAERAGREWKREMVAIDEDRQAARDTYSWEIVATDEINPV